MFMKKKNLPALQQGSASGNQGPGSGSNNDNNNNNPASPTSPSEEFPYGVPTLYPSPVTASPTSILKSPPRIPRHGRSVSQPFPSIPNAGGGHAGAGAGTGAGAGRVMVERGGAMTSKDAGTKPTEIKGGKGSSSKLGFFSNSLPKVSMKSSSQPNEPDLMNGKCATCDSTVRWPRHLDVFRCTVCMMVNDLQYGTMKGTSIGQTQSGRGAGAGLTSPRLPPKVSPVSIDRTKGLINQCTHAYLRHKVEEMHKKAAVPTIPSDHSSSRDVQASDRQLPRHNPFLNATTSGRLNPRSASREPPRGGGGHEGEQDIREKRSFDGGGRPRTAPGQPRMSDDIAPFQPKYIYRHLENYLLSCMNDCDSLNMSFAIARPPAPMRAASETSVQQDTQRRFDRFEGIDGFLGGLDPKMLLLGDIGENARFWLGDGSDHAVDENDKEDGHQSGQTAERPPMYRKNSAPSADRRSPRFNWKAVWDWYQAILLCGRNWRSLRPSFEEADRAFLENPKIEREIDQMLADGRHHVQRTLLKATENLLRHPGRPVKRAEDARFLFILLSNPLLHPQHSHHGNTWTPEKATEAISHKFPDALPSDQAARNLEHARSAAEAASKGSATGHHSGIIKRLMGLIGNLPTECHPTIISWLHRIPVPQLRDLVDLVGGFVSYRLTRNAGRTRAASLDPTNGLIPVLTGPSASSTHRLHDAIGNGPPGKNSRSKEKEKSKENAYADDWQVKAAARVMSLLFFANFGHVRARQQLSEDAGVSTTSSKNRTVRPGQALPLSEYYSVLLDDADLVADFEIWEVKRSKFSFCQFPMFLSIWAKIRLMEHDARRQMQDKARTAFFDSIMTRKVVNQHLILHVRRDCLVEDSLKEISNVVGAGEEEIKKGLKIEFEGEEGVDIGGLRKEWFLLLVREVFDPSHGLFLYDEDSKYCYFNPFPFETSEQYYLVGVVLGLAIYNSTILDINLPPFLFRKLLAAAPPWTGPSISAPRTSMTYTLDDLAEWRPRLARGLRQLLEFDGDVQETFCRDFVVDIDRYGVTTQVPLVPGGERRAVTNSNRREFVDLYVRHVLDHSVTRQFEPFKRGFFAVCSGNALGLFRPEEIELLVRGSDDPLDVSSLQAVALYENWDWGRYGVDVSSIDGIGKKPTPVPAHIANQVWPIRWFWETFQDADPKEQRRLLGFITGSDRIPAMGATSLVITLACLGDDERRFPIARTCFNTVGLQEYGSKETLERRLWTAVSGSEGFGLK